MAKIEAVRNGAPPKGLFSKTHAYQIHQGEKRKQAGQIRRIKRDIFRDLLL